MKNLASLLTSLFVVLLASCGGGKDEPVDPVPSEVEVTGITLAPASLSLETGGHGSIKATVSPANVTDPSVTWTSSAPEVASVADGVVSALSAGDAVITASAGAFSASCSVHVTAPIPPYVAVTSVSLDRKSRLLPLGGSFSLGVTVLPSDATDPAVSWSSSDEAVATVSEGVVTAVSEGRVRIVAEASGFQASCLVTVVPEGPSGKEIWYESWTGAVLKFDDAPDMGVSIVSSTYADGKGIIVFNGEVTVIPSGLFEGRSGLRNIWLPATVTEIAYKAFKGCSTMLVVHLQEGVRSIGDEAFKDCNSLRRLYFPSTLESIGSFAVQGDGMLPDLVIPENVVSLGDYSLYGSTSPASITFLSDAPPALGYRALDETNECPVYVPSASVDVYKSADRWKGYAARIQPGN